MISKEEWEEEQRLQTEQYKALKILVEAFNDILTDGDLEDREKIDRTLEVLNDYKELYWRYM